MILPPARATGTKVSGKSQWVIARMSSMLIIDLMKFAFNMTMETKGRYVDYWQGWKRMGDLERKKCIL